MHPELTPLMDLQKLDVEAKRLRDEIVALPRLVAQLTEKKKATVGQRALILDLLQKEEVLRRRQESDVSDRQTKIARARKQMDAATTTVQVTAYEHEIEFSQKEIAGLEDAELESMERTEQIEMQKRLADQAVAEAEARLAAETERSNTTVAADKLAVAALDTQRAAQRKTISEDTLSLYDRIARSKGTGVAEAWMQKCMSCQMMLRPQKWNDLRDRDNKDMMTCESCGRLLWYDPARDSPTRKTVEHESIAAQIVRGGR